MPWTVDDVDGFKKGLTPKQKRQWVAVANDVLARCEKAGGKDCERKAVTRANGMAGEGKKMGKTKEGSRAQTGAPGQPVREAGRVLSAANEKKLRTALEALADILELLTPVEEEEKEKKEARQPVPLSEAHNAGDWLESRLHLMFTQIADDLFGDGRLTRDERKILSAAIGSALDAFREDVEEKAPQLYQRARWADPEMPHPMGMMDEAQEIAGAYQPLTERAVRPDGTIPIKLIAPGWGSSGYYPPEVLQRDGPKVFAQGVKMFWDHATPTEEAERPEGSLNSLAAELVTPARWADAPAGPGLYADAKVFGGFRDAVDELAPHIGVSIRALGRTAQGNAEGRQGAIVQEISNARSVDFVTEPGAGGQIVEMFEAARKRPAKEQSGGNEEMDQKQQEALQSQIAEANVKIAQLEQLAARQQEALLLREARDFVRAELVQAGLPDITRARLAVVLSSNPPIKDSTLDLETYRTRIQESITAEREYLTAVSGVSGQIQGMGSTSAPSTTPDPEASRKKMEESFRALGLSEKEIVHAVNGRRG